ncbi:hypothetical protein [Mycobacterium nebraskense]|uniref:Uncharacterized protein n=1 Tax=Mycobacterium nebraskense TaxID=244292 RepID=A0A0F5NEC6_9MYCO|nr:hypothetical protein [Mycobacterium nebraskense]KKC05436.1 hypothetical protein WU83_08310 [Mycobacterium nebraskense]KLO36268.1 hypothetical protein ABW17_23015 [Mycobacterium nebraskense]MBI2693478.1 hypothetical protein [Mycobacterium nebraskense]MCV7117417.1 hypothetical protein [Mycobacterium nebraskense]ORW33602.1 hypothetical protein AWC17_24675 [Mycobacterium nebraskense]
MNHLFFVASTAAGWQADGAPQHTGPDFGKASPIGLLIVVLLLIATLLLLRSMNRQLKKVPKSFDPKHPEPDQAADQGTDAVDEADGRSPGHANGSERAPGPGDEPG